MSQGILLYGPPASGKTTITDALTALDARIQLFQRIKVGPGNTSGYRMRTPHVLDQLRRAGHVIFENSRYQATYVIDSPGLTSALQTGIPVIHLGQPEAVPTIADAVPATWLTVALSCRREATLDRLHARGSRDISERLDAWDATPVLPGADLRIDTTATSVADAAALIRARL